MTNLNSTKIDLKTKNMINIGYNVNHIKDSSKKITIVDNSRVKEDNELENEEENQIEDMEQHDEDISEEDEEKPIKESPIPIPKPKEPINKSPIPMDKPEKPLDKSEISKQEKDKSAAPIDKPEEVESAENKESNLIEGLSSGAEIFGQAAMEIVKELILSKLLPKTFPPQQEYGQPAYEEESNYEEGPVYEEESPYEEESTYENEPFYENNNYEEPVYEDNGI
ncbi:ATP-dependent RNA helicase ddx24-like [Octopus sinensis]|uniref:ATP-dependent RNA helicase ddx24-like n=1 Tax=Octopus sinensis TaxID=2607531 RepID=A0A6P7U2R8_9MOLL|nr:ATP-dependent RNA helicase ddx24-like [Octopus sinensis]